MPRNYYKNALLFLLFICSLSLNAQKKERSNTPYLSPDKADMGAPKQSMRFADGMQTQQLAAWLKAPYLNVPANKATVGELTAAFNAWQKAHPEKKKLGSREQDDNTAKYQRQLYRMQMENELDEVPATAPERLAAFSQVEAQNQHTVVQNFTNPDGNWKLLGPVSKPIDAPFTYYDGPEKSSVNLGLGRINCIEFSNWDPRNMWVGTSTGGV